MESQNQRILTYFQQGNRITPLSALQKFGCFRLAARCYDLKQLGYKITKEIIKFNNKHIAEYRLEQK